MSHAEQAKYPTDLSDEQWRILRKLPPQPTHRGAPRTVCCRAVVYLLRGGCAWRLLPREFPKWKTVYGIFLGWRNDRTWQRIHDALRDKLRRKVGRKSSPSAAVLGQSDRQDDRRGRASSRLRRGQENRRSQSAHRGRYARPDPRPRRSFGGRSGSRRGALRPARFGPYTIAVSPSEGDLRRHRLQPQRTSSPSRQSLRMADPDCASTGQGQGIRRVAQTLDRGAHFRLAGTLSSPQQRLRPPARR